MIAPAITRMLKLDPLIRMIAGVVSVADTRYSVSDTVTQSSNHHAKSRGASCERRTYRRRTENPRLRAAGVRQIRRGMFGDRDRLANGSSLS